MLFHLFDSLTNEHSFFNVFRYLTLRAILGVLTALIISFVIGPAVIRKLVAIKMGQTVRDDGPATHLVKAGTPTMGGALILIAVFVATLLWADLTNRFVWTALFTTALFGAIGWVDDWKKVVNKDPRGIGAKQKYFWQTIGGCAAPLVLFFTPEGPGRATMLLTVLKKVPIYLGAGVLTLALL